VRPARGRGHTPLGRGRAPHLRRSLSAADACRARASLDAGEGRAVRASDSAHGERAQGALSRGDGPARAATVRRCVPVHRRCCRSALRARVARVVLSLALQWLPICRARDPVELRLRRRQLLFVPLLPARRRSPRTAVVSRDFGRHERAPSAARTPSTALRDPVTRAPSCCAHPSERDRALRAHRFARLGPALRARCASPALGFRSEIGTASARASARDGRTRTPTTRRASHSAFSRSAASSRRQRRRCDTWKTW
jgi:hypothetical protein